MSSPRKVLAVTFTNKAAGEMARRVEALLAPGRSASPARCTFHAACVRILRQHVRHSGLPVALHHLRRGRPAGAGQGVHAGGGSRRSRAHAGRGRASDQRCQEPDAQPAEDLEKRRAARARRRLAARLSALRGAPARRRAASTSTTCSCSPSGCFEEVPEVLAWYRGLWRYVLVDEYQDTNRAQYRIIRAAHRRAPQHLLSSATATSRSTSGAARMCGTFSTSRRTIPGTRVVRLEQNYRSTKRILAARRRRDRQQHSSPGQDPVDGKRGGGAGQPSIEPGTSTRRRTSWPSASSALRGEGLPGRTWPSSIGPTRSRACWRIPCGGPASPMSSSAACASTSARRSRTRWPTFG